MFVLWYNLATELKSISSTYKLLQANGVKKVEEFLLKVGEKLKFIRETKGLSILKLSTEGLLALVGEV